MPRSHGDAPPAANGKVATLSGRNLEVVREAFEALHRMEKERDHAAGVVEILGRQCLRLLEVTTGHPNPLDLRIELGTGEVTTRPKGELDR